MDRNLSFACVELAGLKPHALTCCQYVWPTIPVQESMAMKGSSDRKGLSPIHLQASETTSTHLSHWPPPLRAKERGKDSKPVLVSQTASEPAKRAGPRGWRLQRAMFSKTDEDD